MNAEKNDSFVWYKIDIDQILSASKECLSLIKTKKRPAGATALSPLEGMLVAVQSASLRRYDPDQVPRIVSPAAKLSVNFYSPSNGTDVLRHAERKTHAMTRCIFSRYRLSDSVEY